MWERKWVLIVGVVAVVALALLVGVAQRTESQTTAAYRVPRTSTGDPDLNGFWQALNTAHYNLESHTAEAGLSTQFPELGALGAIPGGLGVVEGDAIPY